MCLNERLTELCGRLLDDKTVRIDRVNLRLTRFYVEYKP